MSQLGILIKTFFRNQYRKNKGNENAKKNRVGMIIGIVFGFLGFGFFLVLQFWALSVSANMSNLGAQYLSMLFLTIQGFTLVVGSISLGITLFASKDNVFLATLPVKGSTIYFAKLFFVYINELIIAVPIGGIGIVVYSIIASPSFLFVIVAILGVLLAPIISLFAASILMLPVMAVVKNSKRNAKVGNAIKIFTYLIGMGIYFYFISSVSSNFDAIDGNYGVAAMQVKAMGEALFFNFAFANIAFGIDVLKNLLIVFVTYGAGAVLAGLLSDIIFRRGFAISATNSEMKVAKQEFKTTNIIKSLLLRDYRQTMRNSQLFFQIVIGLIMGAFMMVALFGFMYPKMGMQGEELKNMISIMGVLFAVLFSIGVNVVGSSSISRENRTYYMMKIIPVDYKTQIKAKLILAYIFVLIPIILQVICLAIFGLDMINVLIVFISLLILGFGICAMQVRFDLQKPRLNWTTFQEGIKNNSSSFISMVITLLFAILIMGVVNLTRLEFLTNIIETNILRIASASILFIAVTIFSIVEKNKLFKRAEENFLEIEG